MKVIVEEVFNVKPRGRRPGRSLYRAFLEDYPDLKGFGSDPAGAFWNLMTLPPAKPFTVEVVHRKAIKTDEPSQEETCQRSNSS